MANRLPSILLALAVAGVPLVAGALGAPAAGAAPKNAIEFFARTPHGTASCAIYDHYAGSTEAFCESFRPGRESKAAVNGRGKVSICASKNTRADRCGLGNAGENTPTFGKGRKVTVGAFRCAVERRGVRCVVIASGKGFLFNPSRAIRVGPGSK
jgi:hypothetical protein